MDTIKHYLIIKYIMAMVLTVSTDLFLGYSYLPQCPSRLR
jgi:hypothetical protein